jgi:hypothetical protein
MRRGLPVPWAPGTWDAWLLADSYGAATRANPAFPFEWHTAPGDRRDSWGRILLALNDDRNLSRVR